MKKVRFVIMVLVVLASVPALFLAQINYSKAPVQPNEVEKQEVIEQTEAGSEKESADYISVVMVSIVH
jgi:hypothetical protein